MKLKDSAPWRKAMTNLEHIKKERHYFANTGSSTQSYGFSSSHVWMWELDYKESWTLKNWCFWTVVLEKTLESPLDYKEVQPVKSKGNQSWIFIGRTDAEAETPILCKMLTPCKRPWCWERLKAGREGDDRGWDVWMASPARWTWVWASSRRAAVRGVAKSQTTELLNSTDWGFYLLIPFIYFTYFLTHLPSGSHPFILRIWICFQFVLFECFVI